MKSLGLKQKNQRVVFLKLFCVFEIQWAYIKHLQQVFIKEEGIFVASCVEVVTVSQGYSIEEALQNLKESTELYLEEF